MDMYLIEVIGTHHAIYVSGDSRSSVIEWFRYEHPEFDSFRLKVVRDESLN